MSTFFSYNFVLAAHLNSSFDLIIFQNYFYS